MGAVAGLAKGQTFTIYHKGDVAIDSGAYDGYETPHWYNYYIRTIAHNTIVIHDRSRVDNFQLVGGSITDVKKTGLRFVGTVRWHLQLGSGRYRYFSGAHPQTMQGRFRVA